jgi:hypothetical protein
MSREMRFLCPDGRHDRRLHTRLESGFVAVNRSKGATRREPHRCPAVAQREVDVAGRVEHDDCPRTHLPFTCRHRHDVPAVGRARHLVAPLVVGAQRADHLAGVPGQDHPARPPQGLGRDICEPSSQGKCRSRHRGSPARGKQERGGRVRTSPHRGFTHPALWVNTGPWAPVDRSTSDRNWRTRVDPWILACEALGRW